MSIYYFEIAVANLYFITALTTEFFDKIRPNEPFNDLVAS
jgi:hypothetical protein